MKLILALVVIFAMIHAKEYTVSVDSCAGTYTAATGAVLLKGNNKLKITYAAGLNCSAAKSVTVGIEERQMAYSVKADDYGDKKEWADNNKWVSQHLVSGGENLNGDGAYGFLAPGKTMAFKGFNRGQAALTISFYAGTDNPKSEVTVKWGGDFWRKLTMFFFTFFIIFMIILIIAIIVLIVVLIVKGKK